PGPPLSGGAEAAITAASVTAPGAGAVPSRTAGSVSRRQPSRTRPCAAGSSCLIRGVMSQPQRSDARSPFGEQFPRPSAAVPAAATMLLMVGLPGAGKTTQAKELAAAHRALRLTPDHWMIPLFGEPLADGKRFVLEGRLISVALQALRLGTSVVLDFGLWGRDDRSALRWLARSAGA